MDLVYKYASRSVAVLEACLDTQSQVDVFTAVALGEVLCPEQIKDLVSVLEKLSRGSMV
jgi:hypothetical protein